MLPKSFYDHTIVIPVFNEQNVLNKSVIYLVDYLRKQSGLANWQIVIADNGSTDQTLAVAREIAQRFEHVYVLSLKQKGRGYALKSAWDQYPAQISLSYIDADMDVHPQIIKQGIEQIFTGYEVVFGARSHKQSQITRKWHRKLMTVIASCYARALFSRDIDDMQCGVKIIKPSLWSKISLALKETGWFFDSELVLRAKKSGFQVTSLPVEDVSNRLQITRTSKVRIIADSLGYILALIRIKIRLRNS